MTIKLRSCIFASAFSLAYSGMALSTTAFDHADFYDAGNITLSAGGQGTPPGVSTVKWDFNILDNGYDPTTESVTSAVVSLLLADDRRDPGRRFNIETAQLTAGETVFDTFTVVTGTQTFTLNSLTTLSDTGILSMQLDAVVGDFVFKSAELGVHDVYVPAVPVPAAVWLFGSGLLGLIGVARAKKQA